MTRKKGQELEHTSDLNIMEWIKADLVESVAALLKALVKKDQEDISDAVATVLISTYLLGQRAGVSYQSMESMVKWKLANSLDLNEDGYTDLMGLLKYLEQQKR